MRAWTIGLPSRPGKDATGGMAPTAVSHEIAAGDHRDDARHGGGHRGVDGADLRMRDACAHEGRMGLAGHHEIVGEASAAGDERRVLAANRLSAAAEPGAAILQFVVPRAHAIPIRSCAGPVLRQPSLYA